jgi:hypothetical protein
MADNLQTGFPLIKDEPFHDPGLRLRSPFVVPGISGGRARVKSQIGGTFFKRRIR